MAGNTSVISGAAITTGTNHAGVKRFRGYSIRVSGASVVRFRQASVGGAIILVVDVPVGTSTIFFPGYFIATGGVYVELVSGTFTEGQLING